MIRGRPFRARADEADDAEIAARIAAVRSLKERWGAEVPLEVLDRVLPPVSCLRTRVRERRPRAGVPDLRNGTKAERR